MSPSAAACFMLPSVGLLTDAAFQSVTLCHLLVWLFDHSLLPFDHWMLPFYVAIGPLDRSVMDAALSPLGTAF